MHLLGEFALGRAHHFQQIKSPGFDSIKIESAHCVDFPFKNFHPMLEFFGKTLGVCSGMKLKINVNIRRQVIQLLLGPNLCMQISGLMVAKHTQFSVFTWMPLKWTINSWRAVSIPHMRWCMLW